MEKEIINRMNKEQLEKEIKSKLLGSTIFDADLSITSKLAKCLRETTLIEELI